MSELRTGSDGGVERVDELAAFTVEHVGSSVVMRIAGEVDMLTTPRLSAELAKLIEAEPRVVVVDLADVSFFASSGLAALVEARDAAAEGGVALRLACMSRSVRRPLQITGLAGRFETYDDVQAALDA